MQFKNRAILQAIAFWKKRTTLNEVDPIYPRYLIVSTTGLGDTLWGTAAIKALKLSQPTSYIAVLTSQTGKAVLETNPYVDRIYVLKPSLLSQINLIYNLRTEHLQTALIFHTSQRLAIPLAVASGVSRIIGTEGINKGLDCLLTTALPTSPIHEIERRLAIVAEVGTAPSQFDHYLDLYLTADDLQMVHNFLAPYDLPPYIPLVGIHPGAKDTFKCWPPNLFIELANRLRNTLGCQIVITGNRDEQALVDSIVREVPGAIACYELAVRPFAALIKAMRLFITNDTGPMHLSFATHTPTLALFGPTDPRRCGPHLAPNVSIIKKAPTCSPCLRKKCVEPFCMLQISPDSVYEAALKLLGDSP